MAEASSRIPLLIPDLPTLDEITPYLRRIDENRWYSNFGPLCTEFEFRLEQFLGPSDAPPALTTVANCTLGLELALSALDLPKGARVLVPALTFLATATAVLRAGYTPVFADVDSKTWMLTASIAETALGIEPIDAILPVAAFCCSQPVGEWDRLADDHGIPVLIDAAGALGNQAVGTNAVVAYSLHATKSLGAGEGGVVAAQDPVLIERVRRATNFGIDLNIGLATVPGTNAKMSEYHCAVGLAALDHWKQTSERRIELRERYRHALSGEPICFQKGLEESVVSILPIQLPARLSARQVSAELRTSGVETRTWYLPPLNHHPIFKGFPTSGPLTETQALGDSLLGLPFHTGLELEDVDFVCTKLRDILHRSA